MSDEPQMADFDVLGCTHRCLLPAEHVEHGHGHFYGYRSGPHAADDFVPDGYMLVKIPDELPKTDPPLTD